MLGKLGGVVIESEGIFRINPTLDFISEAEKELLEKIVILGSFYLQIKSYIEAEEEAFATRAISRRDTKEEEGLDQGPYGNSAYVRCLCGAVRGILSEYELEVVGVEQEYLASKVYTFSKFAVTFANYYAVFPEIIVLFERIEKEGLRGGKLVDMVYRSSINGNEVIRSFHTRLLEKLYGVLYNQIVIWIVHGKIHDSFDEFFIHRLNPDKEDVEDTFQEEWNNTFEIRLSMLPVCLISHITAEKILFIGKFVRVINQSKEDGKGRIYSKETFQLITGLSKFDFVSFQDGIEAIRGEVGKEFLQMFLHKENIEEHLGCLKDYYLLGRGDFYQIFIEETQNMFRFPPNNHSESDLNKRVLPATLMRMNWTNNKLLKTIRFQLSNSGFEHKEFTSLHGLIAKGDVTQPANSIRFGPARKGRTSACLYHPTAQSILNGFDFRTAFKFRRSISSFDTGKTLPEDFLTLKNLPKDLVGLNCITFIIQNCIDINSSFG